MKNAQAHVAFFADRQALVARMEAALQRRDAAQRPAPPIRVGALLVCPDKRTASWQGKALDLSPKEFDILATLAMHCGQALSRTFLFDELWSDEFAGEERLIDRHVMKLRKKLGDGASLIETVWGSGYRLVTPAKKPRSKSRESKRGAPA